MNQPALSFSRAPRICALLVGAGQAAARDPVTTGRGSVPITARLVECADQA